MTVQNTDSPNQAINVLLVDDQPAVRYGLQLLFQLEIEPMRFFEAGTSAEAMAALEGFRPDVVIMDVELPDRDGISATRQLTKMFPRCVVIILTIHGRPELRANALAAGAWAFVEKGRPEEMRAALHRAIGHLKANPLPLH